MKKAGVYLLAGLMFFSGISLKDKAKDLVDIVMSELIRNPISLEEKIYSIADQLPQEQYDRILQRLIQTADENTITHLVSYAATKQMVDPEMSAYLGYILIDSSIDDEKKTLYINHLVASSDQQTRIEILEYLIRCDMYPEPKKQAIINLYDGLGRMDKVDVVARSVKEFAVKNFWKY